MLTYANSVNFVKGELPPVVLRNFSPPEDGFIWSSSSWSEIVFGFSATLARGTKRADVNLDLDVFKIVGHLDGQNVLTYLNGLRVGSYHITQRTTVTLQIDAAILKRNDNVLTFDTPDSRKPSEFGLSDDRRLGIQLFSMEIRPEKILSKAEG